MTEDKRNVLRLAKDGEGTCLDCEWGTSLFGGGKGAVCLHTGKKNINELTRCEKWIKQKQKEDKKDEMKNRISLALKDPILQQGFEIICKENAEFEEKISVLLSCKNCPENKGGYICAKEYENKCLAQKIEFIKELQQENAELKLKLDALEGQTPWKDIKDKSEVIGKLTEAKELLAKWVELFKPKSETALPTPIQVETEQFLNSEVKK